MSSRIGGDDWMVDSDRVRPKTLYPEPKKSTQGSTIGSFRHQIIVGELDISDYVLGGQITRTLSNPVGSWTVNLRPLLGQNDNRIKRLDIGLNNLAELRLDRSTEGKPQLVMRGFVDAEEFSEKPSQSNDGSPGRTYTLSGSDTGKMLERRQIFIPNDISAASIHQFLSKQSPIGVLSEISQMEVTDMRGINSSFVMPISKWVNFFIQKVYKTEYERVVNMTRNSGQKIFTMSTQVDVPMIASQLERFHVSLAPLMNNQNGSMWNFIEYYCKKPFIETFIEDNEDSTIFNVRWSPHKKEVMRDGNRRHEYPMQSNGLRWFNRDVERFGIYTSAILERRMRRQESDRYTYFNTILHPFLSSSGINIPVGGGDQPYNNPYYDTAGFDQFGYRPMVSEVPWLPLVDYALDTSNPRYGLEVANTLADLTQWLVDSFTYTDQLYQGFITLIGNTDITVGSELHIKDTDEEYYVESVEHIWQVWPAPQFITRLGVTRGTINEYLTADNSAASDPFTLPRSKFIQTGNYNKPVTPIFGLVTGGDTDSD